LNKKQKDSFIKVMTLNVNGFRRIGNRGLSNQFCLRNMKQIRQLIDTVMINKNNIIILQEVPHKIKDNQDRKSTSELQSRFDLVDHPYLHDALPIVLNKKQKDSFIKVMTLNVNGFRRIGNRGLSNQFCLRNMKQIRQLIDTVMINKNNIIILQEVPHKIKDN